VDSNFGNVIASSSQPRDQLENRESENDKMLRKVQKAMETGVEKIRMAKAKERGGQRGSRKETGRTENEEEEGQKNGRSKESSREMEDLGQREGDSKVGRGSIKVEVLAKFHQ